MADDLAKIELELELAAVQRHVRNVAEALPYEPDVDAEVDAYLAKRRGVVVKRSLARLRERFPDGPPRDKRRSPPKRPPVYDETYWRGMAWLDALASGEE